jgi:pilus assembly protein Flp/PilA
MFPADNNPEETAMFKTLWKDEEGLTTVEYALLLALVAIAAITAWTTLGGRVSSTVTKATSSLPGS